MSFSMEKIQANLKSKQHRKPYKVNHKTGVDTKGCFIMINNLDILTDNVKLALRIFLRKRLEAVGVTHLTKELFYEHLQELLSYCCEKPFLKISIKDVELCEGKIIYNLRATLANRHVKDVFMLTDVNNQFATSTIVGRQLEQQEHVAIQQEWINNYLEGVEII